MGLCLDIGRKRFAGRDNIREVLFTRGYKMDSDVRKRFKFHYNEHGESKTKFIIPEAFMIKPRIGELIEINGKTYEINQMTHKPSEPIVDYFLK